MTQFERWMLYTAFGWGALDLLWATVRGMRRWRVYRVIDIEITDEGKDDMPRRSP